MQNSSCLTYAFTILTIAGLWKHKHVSKNMYYVYSLIFQTLFLFPIVYMESVFFRLSFSGSTEDIMLASTFLLLHKFQIVKMCIYLYKYEDILDLINEIDGESFTRKEGHSKQILYDSLKTIKWHSRILFLLVSVSAAIVTLCPLLEPTIKLPMKYPFMTTENNLFWFVYGYQISTLLLSGFSQMALDFFISGLISIVASEIEVLSYEISIIGKRNTEEIMGKEFTDYDLMKNCIKFHQKIISVVRKINHIFGYFLLYQFFCSCVAICSTTFTLSLVTESLKLLPLAFYLTCVLFQLWIYCYYGEKLKTKSENLYREAYLCNWYNTTLKTQKILLIMMMQARTPLVISAGGLFELSLENYSKILKTSYSYYSVLSNTKN